MRMKFAVVTIFPDMVETVKRYGVIRKAVEKGILEINVFDLRKFTDDKHRTVDGYPFGGGPGMVMRAEPFFKFYDFYVKEYGKPYTVLMTPQGNVFDNDKAMHLASKRHILIMCGRYEGIDERVKSIVDEEISIGDYVLTGGELAAMVVIDATSRFVPGVVEEESLKRESFMENLLDHPVYTRPREIRGMKVPEVLLSGDHEKVEVWRRKEAIKKTILKRPDLFMKRDFDDLDKKAIMYLVRELIESAG